RPRAELELEEQILALAEQVAFSDTDVAQDAGRRGEARTKRDFAGRALAHVYIDDGLVRGRALRVRHFHLLEEAEIVDAPFCAAKLRGVEGIAFHDWKLATDDLINRAHIALDID